VAVLRIRPQHIEAFRPESEQALVTHVARHLFENYGNATVRLPGADTRLRQLPPNRLRALVEIAIDRARGYGLTMESGITGYAVLMFLIAPNFDLDDDAKRILTEDAALPELRVDKLWQNISEAQWKKIRATCDPEDWKPRPKPDSGSTAEPDPTN
jgi:hypothetical protein